MENARRFQTRRHYFVSWAIQGKLVLGILAAAVLSFVLVLVDFYWSFGRNAGWDPAMLEIFLKAQKLPLVQMIVFVFVLVFLTLYFSHRVAGPLVNLEKSLARVAAGDLTTRMRLRPRDQVKNIRDAFNAAVDSLQGRVRADRSRADEIAAALDRFASGANLDPGARAEWESLRNRLGALTRDFTI